jgi:hypothetical protein
MLKFMWRHSRAKHFASSIVATREAASRCCGITSTGTAMLASSVLHVVPDVPPPLSFTHCTYSYSMRHDLR